MDKRLQVAIEEGIVARQAAEESEQQRKSAERQIKESMFKRNIAYAKTKHDEVFKLIKEATAQDNKQVTIYSNTIDDLYDMYALYTSLESVEGLKVEFEDGNDYINSDEVKEYWQKCVIKW